MKTKVAPRLLALVMALVLSITLLPTVAMADGGSAGAVQVELANTLDYILATVPAPIFDTNGGDWSVLALARSNRMVPSGYFEDYYGRIEAEVANTAKYPNTPKMHDAKSTENTRLILALTAIGKDATDVGGYDLTAPLADLNWVKAQGVNGAIFALLAFDSGNYSIPTDSTAAVQTTRENLVAYILSQEISGGGFSLSGTAPGVTAGAEVTAMAIQALIPYMDDAEVAAVIDRAVAVLSAMQDGNGGYGILSENTSQVIMALSALGIDAMADPRFVKSGGNPVSALLEFAVSGGGFKHISTQQAADGMATDQAAQALIAYDRFLNGENSIYDMSDVFIKPGAPVSVSISYQADNTGFVIARKVFSVDADLSERYGYADDFNGAKATALDVLVAAHIAVFGDDIAVINSKLGFGSGFASNFMGDGSGMMFYYINGETPLSAASEQEVFSGDVVAFAAVRDQMTWSDRFGYFKNGGVAVDTLRVKPDEEFTLTLATEVMDWGSGVSTETPVANANIVKVTAGSGNTAAFEPLGQTTDANGEVTLKFTQKGTYIIAATEAQGELPLISPWLVVTAADEILPAGAPVSVSISYQADNTGFVIARKAFAVETDLSERYGYADDFNGAKATALDVLVAAHIAVFGDDIATINSKLGFGSGFASNFMGDGAGMMFYYINGETPLIAASEQEVFSGDTVKFADVRDQMTWSDMYGYFKDGDTKVESISVKTNQEFTLKLATDIMDWGSGISTETPVANANIMKVTTGSGNAATFEPLSYTTDANGEVKLKFTQAGTYIIAATEAQGELPLISPWLVVTVTSNTLPPVNQKITVSFRLVGATSSTGDVDLSNGSYKGSEYVTWIATKNFSMDKGDTIYTLFTKALSGAGIASVGADKDYVTAITAPKSAGGHTMKEFTNGQYSGWMYTVNGVHVGTGLKGVELKDGDVVVWHYVNDYRYETSDWAGSIPGSGTYLNRWLLAADKNPTTATTPPSGGGAPAVAATPKPSSTPIPSQIPPVTPTPAPTVGGYADVQVGEWFADAVKYVSEAGIMTGTGDGSFSPNADVTRAMLATMLYRQSGASASSVQNPFTDVAEGEWYTLAILWGVENDIVTGYGDSTFGPNDALTREQIAAILYRYAGHLGKNTEQRADISGYADADAVSDWAREAIQWANAVGIINGRSETDIAPLGNATRAEMAAMIQRFIVNY